MNKSSIRLSKKSSGFTLVELLAVVVIISVLGSIVGMGVISYINTSRDKAEDKFIDEISNEIDSFITLNSDNFVQDKFTGTIVKGTSSLINDENTLEVYKMKYNNSDFITFDKILENMGSGNEDEYKNPKNNKSCSLEGIKISVYRDTDFVYYYTVDFNGSECGIGSDKNIIPEEIKYFK